MTPLKPNTYHTLKWRMTPEGMTVSDNGKVVFSEKRAYDLLDSSKVYLWAENSNVDVKEFKFKRIHENEK